MSKAVDPLELERLRTLYREMDDQGLASALYYGPESYLAAEAWAIITEEASGRGIAVPKQEEREAYWDAVRAEEAASQPPKLPWGWRLYFWLLTIFLIGFGQETCHGLVAAVEARQTAENWRDDDLKLYLHSLAWLIIALLLMGVQYAHVRSRLSGKADRENLPPS